MREQVLKKNRTFFKDPYPCKKQYLCQQPEPQKPFEFIGFKVSILSPSPFFCIKMKHLFKCQALFLAEEGGNIWLGSIQGPGTARGRVFYRR
jgi:hypothetical protein